MKKMKEDKLIELTVEKTKDILEKAGVDAEISASLSSTEDERKYVNLSINGDNLGLLIGFQGMTLSSFEHVLSLIVNKILRAKEEQGLRIIVDVNDYKQKREKLIGESALQAAMQAKESMQPVELPVMSPAERRIVHLALQEEDGITTESEGEEGDRRVIIKPAQKEPAK